MDAGWEWTEWEFPEWAVPVVTDRVALPRWQRVAADLQALAAEAEVVSPAVLVAAGLAVLEVARAVPRCGAVPECEAVVGDAAVPTGKGDRMPWRSATGGVTRALLTTAMHGSLGRIFRIGERRSADLQFHAQNLLNRVTITNWGTVVGATNYGLTTSAAAMRKITLNLRFRF